MLLGAVQLVLVARCGVSAVWGVRILVWGPKNAQCLGCDGTEASFESDLFTKSSREGDQLNIGKEG